MKLIKPYLLLMVIVWLPWGLVCIFNTAIIEDIIGVTGLHSTGTTDIRVMYGGVQSAVGLMALVALFRNAYLKHTLFGLAFLGCTMAFARGYGMIIDNSPTFYNWGIICFEAFTGLSALIWLKSLPKN